MTIAPQGSIGTPRSDTLLGMHVDYENVRE